MQVKLRDDEGDHALTVRHQEGGWLVTADGTLAGALVLRAAGGAWLVGGPDGPRRRVWVAVHRDERLAFCDGRVFRLRRPDPVHADEGGGTATDGPDLFARMPGRVVRLMAEAGQAVVAGQPLVIMESMKMETELGAPCDGTVARIAVGVGQIVAQGDLLVAVSPAGAD